MECVALILCIILLFGPGIAFWWAGHVWEKKNKEEAKKQSDEPDIEFPGGEIKGL